MIYPSELELLAFFGTEHQRSDEVTLFRVTDTAGVRLDFSFDEADDSVQTALYVAGRCICLVSHERMTRFWVDDGTLRVEFTSTDYAVALGILVQPEIRVEWSGLKSS